MSAEPLFSVVIPAYNRAETIGQTLESVAAQRFHDFETIVVDDGSTDNTCDVVRGFDFVQLIQQSNGGPGAARNRGAQASRGEYLAFLDSDDLWFPWTLEVFARAIQVYRSPGLIAASMFSFVGSTPEIKEQQFSAEYFSDFLAAQVCSGCFVGAGMTVVETRALLHCGGFNEHIANGEDHDLILRLGIVPGFVRIHTPNTLAWRRHELSTTNNLVRTIEGVRFLLRGESTGRFPGGLVRARQRLVFLSARVRSTSFDCLAEGRSMEGLVLYVRTLPWHVVLHRWKYILGFPLRFIIQSFSRRKVVSRFDGA